jgi:hypothetical protein
MTWKGLLLLGLLGFTMALIVAAFQSTPGYMDADAYYAGGRQLVTGHGFTENYLWNYLDDPGGVPHPSNAYWMPMASLLAAAGMGLFRSGTWWAARMGFLVICAFLPPLTASLAWMLSSRRDLALTSGLLAVFPAFYMPFLPVTDTFGCYMLLGGMFFLILFVSIPQMNDRFFLIASLLLGIVSGLMHLARADGVSWLLMAIIAVLFVLPKPPKKRSLLPIYGILLCIAGYLLIMAPWFTRNVNAFGFPLAPGGGKMLWLTDYDQLYAYPANQITWQAWLQSGLAAIAQARLWSLGLNLANTLTVQGEVFLLPLIGLGFWHLRKDRRVLMAGFGWLMTLGVMTIVFPFAGARGGFFHSGAALQVVWWVLAPVGLERVIEWGRKKRGWRSSQAGRIFRLALVSMAVLVTVVIVWGRVVGGGGGGVWDQENALYGRINQYLVSQGAGNKDMVMVANPPGFFLVSGNPSIAVPSGNVDTLLSVAQKYGALYLVLESGSVPAGLHSIYDDPRGQPDLIFLSEVENARIFLFRHH